jgi:uncharacterized protein YbbK (DUF523 family)
VVFVSHCLLDANVRYLGGAARSGVVDELVDAVQRAGVGICQMACPEQQAWGGILRPWMYLAYGADRRGLGAIRRLVVPVFLEYTRWRFGRLARRVAAEIADLERAGCEVIGVVGVDGSPSCGVGRTLALDRAIGALAGCDPSVTDSATFNDRVVLANVTAGEGLFISAVRRRLRRGHHRVPLFAHDLPRELAGGSGLPPGLAEALGR